LLETAPADAYFPGVPRRNKIEQRAMSHRFAAEEIRRVFEEARDMDASMGERLGAFANAARRLTPSAAAVVDRLIGRLREHGAGETAPKPGDAMPPFVLPDENGQLVSLKSLHAKGPAIVTFHRGHWCPYCRISINTLARAQERIEHLGARMAAIVPERAPLAAEMKNESGVRFPILLDIDNGYATSLNLAIWVGPEMIEFMTSIDRNLPEYQGNDSWMLPIPATFVIGVDGKVKARFVDPDYRNRMSVEALVDALAEAR
jgi:peroxiredoxin